MFEDSILESFPVTFWGILGYFGVSGQRFGAFWGDVFGTAF